MILGRCRCKFKDKYDHENYVYYYIFYLSQLKYKLNQYIAVAFKQTVLELERKLSL